MKWNEVRVLGFGCPVRILNQLDALEFERFSFSLGLGGGVIDSLLKNLVWMISPRYFSHCRTEKKNTKASSRFLSKQQG